MSVEHFSSHADSHHFHERISDTLKVDVRGKRLGCRRVNGAYVVLRVKLPTDGGEDRNGWRGGSGRKRSKRRHRRRWLTEVVVVGAYITGQQRATGGRDQSVTSGHRRHRQTPPPRRRRHARVQLCIPSAEQSLCLYLITTV